MADDPIKRRLTRAKARAERDLRYLDFKIVHSNNKPVCLVAIRGQDVRLIRICLDEITVQDKKSLSPFTDCQREIWLRRAGKESFEIHKL